MIRFLEGLLCGALLGYVGLDTIQKTLIQIVTAMMQIVQHFMQALQCNGSTRGFGPRSLGSNPNGAVNQFFLKGQRHGRQFQQGNHDGAFDM